MGNYFYQMDNIAGSQGRSMPGAAVGHKTGMPDALKSFHMQRDAKRAAEKTSNIHEALARFDLLTLNLHNLVDKIANRADELFGIQPEANEASDSWSNVGGINHKIAALEKIITKLAHQVDRF